MEAAKRRESVLGFAALAQENDNGEVECKMDHPTQEGEGAVKDDGVSANDCRPETTPQTEDERGSLRKAAGCFKRQITLLRALDRFCTPLPALDPQVRLHGVGVRAS